MVPVRNEGRNRRLALPASLLAILVGIAPSWAAEAPAAEVAPSTSEGAPSTTESAPAGGAHISVDVSPREATVGDRLRATVQLDLPPDTKFDPPSLGSELGSFTVMEGAWRGPEVSGERLRYTWSGTISAFRTGETALPPVRLSIEHDDGRREELSSEPVSVTVQSVLPPEPQTPEAEIADIKQPASIRPDFRLAYTAAGILVLLLVASAVLWWLHRRYASRLAAVPQPSDPFHRVPPHLWVYEELKRLLERRLPEQGQVELFFEELGRIVKLYLGGRFRVDLLERTTAEVPETLRQAGAPAAAIDEVVALLADCDQVKFARYVPDAALCRAAVDRAYRIADGTRPVAEPAENARGAA